MKTIQPTGVSRNNHHKPGTASLVNGFLSGFRRRPGPLLIAVALIAFPGQTCWSASPGFFIAASPAEIGGGIVLGGLCLATLIFGLRLVFRSAGRRR